MAKKKEVLPYSEGTWFAVPLRSSGYAVGVVSRMTGGGGVFGYFFGPKRAAVPNLEQVSNLSPQEAFWLAQFGDLGLLKGKWPIIGRTKDWRRELWPLPPFIRLDLTDPRRAVKVIYSDDNLERLDEETCDPALAKIYPEDGLSGAGAVEIWLTKILNEPNQANTATSVIPEGASHLVPVLPPLREKAKKRQNALAEQAVKVHLRLSDDAFGTAKDREAIFALEDQLEAAIEETATGEFDGDEFGQGECVLFMYGPDADQLFAAILPVLRSSRLAEGGWATKRHGDVSDPDAREVRVQW
jgi:hypothetical protein